MKRKRSGTSNSIRLLSPTSSPAELFYNDSRKSVALLSGIQKSARLQSLLEPNLIPMINSMVPYVPTPLPQESYNYVPTLGYSVPRFGSAYPMHPDAEYIIMFMDKWSTRDFLLSMGRVEHLKELYKNVYLFFKKHLNPYNMREQTEELQYLVLQYIHALEELLIQGDVHPLYGSQSRRIDSRFPNDPLIYVQSLRLQIIEYTRNVVQAMRRTDYSPQDLDMIQQWKKRISLRLPR